MKKIVSFFPSFCLREENPSLRLGEGGAGFKPCALFAGCVKLITPALFVCALAAMALVLPLGGLGLADSEWPKPTEALSECLNDSILLSASENELSQNYLTRLDTAMVLCFQAGYENPEKPEIWKRLAFLAETKSFFVTDPKDRDDLMDEAAAHYRHSASLEYERASQAFLDYSEKAPTLGLSDPYLNELVWLGRMRRGEVTMAEIYQRHSAENLEPIHKPEFWEELAQLIQSERDPAKREKELGSAREEFKKL
ncbi:MAG: hypothetical protein LBU69_05720, partial [Deltaproteobacteria bacterium]|nr:hypothetical protein [Deltaproteobacteria bacterium]